MKLAQLIVGATLIGSAALAHALDTKPYSAEALAAAEKAGSLWPCFSMPTSARPAARGTRCCSR